jgi:hypothetical protein
MNRWGGTVVALLLGSCSEPRVIGTASLLGDVFRADGSRWSSVAIEATCSGGTDTTRLTASPEGSFGIDFQFPSDQPSTRDCRFAVPSLAAPQAATTKTIWVYPPDLQPVQFITLTEGVR